VDVLSVAGGGSVSGIDVVGRFTLGSGTAEGDTIGKSAEESVVAGVASGETVLRFGELDLGLHGVAIGTIVRGGTIAIQPGGVASGTVLSSGSRELLNYRDSGTTILSGAVEEVLSGNGVNIFAVATGSLISNGGFEIVSSGGEVASAIVFGGGTLSVTKGGKVTGGVTLSGGTAILSGTAFAGQTVTFGASGTLALGNLPGFGAAISGLQTSAQKVDLKGFASSTGETVGWVQSGTSGTLTVTDGAKVAHLTLIGSYATSDFKLAADGHGGTFVFDPRPAPAGAQLAQAAAGLPGGRFGAEGPVVHAGGGRIAAAAPVVAAVSGR
jgi:autotransporter passenger strand-loop-strand repeat protein